MEALNLFGIIMAFTGGFALGMMSIYIVQIYSDWQFEKKNSISNRQEENT